MRLPGAQHHAILTSLLMALFLTLTMINNVGAERTTDAATGETGYIIQLEGSPLATYQGTVPGLAATNPRAAGTRKLESRSSAARLYSDHLGRKRAETLSRIERELGRSAKIKQHYDTVFNGVAVEMNADEAALVAKLPGVLRVEQDRQVKIEGFEETMPSAAMIGLGGKSAPASGRTDIPLLILAGLMVLVTLWGAARPRKICSWLWVFLSTVLLFLTAACGSHEEEKGERIITTVEAPAYLSPSPGAAWIGAKGVWTGADSGGLPATMGEGIVVGIIDTGISPHSPSFAAVGGDGYRHKNPRGKYYGVCDPENEEIYNPTFACNDKLIGAWSYIDDTFNNTTGNAVDFASHGSHVAATAAGNIVHEVFLHFPTGYELTTSISGVAPHANIISYRVLGADGSGPTSRILAGIEQAVRDGVDVINLSLGGGLYDPWENISYGIPLLNVRAAGVFVAVAAGNSGPLPATIGSPAVSPWVTSVAAGTHDVAYVNKISFNGGAAELADIRGLSLSSGYGPAPVVYAGNFGDPMCLGHFSSSFNGEIVICDQGEIPLTGKVTAVKKNGGGGMILDEIDPGGTENLAAEGHLLTAVNITAADASRLKSWLVEGTGHRATISGTTTEVSAAEADIVTGFSSRGWNRAALDNIKPDILAPGNNILAAAVDGIGYVAMRGTSMASPHVAGVFALLKALHPEWTPSEAQSAIMMTSFPGAKEDEAGTAATPFTAGAGRIDAGRAARAALVLDETPEGFRQADPKLFWESTDGSGLTSAMNLASLGNGSCIKECSWTRKVRSVSAGNTTWSAAVSADSGLLLRVTPGNFTLAPGESREIVVTADVTGVPLDEWAFGRLLLTETAGLAPNAGMPVAVRNQRIKIPPSLEIVTDLASGSKEIRRLEAQNIGNLAISIQGLIPAVLINDVIDSDPTPKDPLNGDGGIYLVNIEVPAGATALFVNLDSSIAPDLDLFVGKAGSWNPLAVSGSGGSKESVIVPSPEAGTWWIAAQNFASGRTADPFTLRYGVVAAGEQGNLTVLPDRRNASPFSLNLSWNLPGIAAGDLWYGTIQLGTSAATANDIGIIPLKLVGKAPSLE